MYRTLLASFALTLASEILFASFCRAQDSAISSSVQESKTVRNDEKSPSESINEKRDWWPPIIPEQEVTQSSIQRFSPWLQPPIPASHYLSSAGPSLAGPIGQVRSEHYAYPVEHGEYAHSSSPIVSQSSSNALGSLGSKHLAIVSFIGLLLLFAVIQNSLMSAKRKDALVDALTGRKKRDVFDVRGLTGMTPEQEDMWNDDARLRCVQRTVCLENRRIVEDLGPAGKNLAKHTTDDVTRSMPSAWGRLVEDAGQAGLKGENCDVLYRDCTMTKLRDPPVETPRIKKRKEVFKK